MQFKIQRIELLNALNKVTRAVSSKSPLPVLTGIKFDISNSDLILTGSDSDITIQDQSFYHLNILRKLFVKLIQNM